MEWIERSGIQLGVFPALEAVTPRLRLWFTSRSGGVSPAPYDTLNLGEFTDDAVRNVRANRRRLLDALHIDARRVARGAQVHGAHIEVAHRGGLYRGTDGFITRTIDLALAINTADCYPVAIFAPSEKVLAALHVGRGGASRGIIDAAVRTMRERYAIETRHTIATIGPGICRRCYTVDGKTAKSLPARYVERRGGAYHIDLLSYCTDRLMEGGLRRHNIFRAKLCTSCRRDLFFSYRGDGKITGRQWMLAMIAATA